MYRKEVRYVTTVPLSGTKLLNLEPSIQIESSPAVAGVLAMARCASTRSERNPACVLAMARNWSSGLVGRFSLLIPVDRKSH